jgi:NADH dehydrogenase
MALVKIAIIGFGFAGQSAYQRLKHVKNVELIVFNKTPENIFLPLLPEALSNSIDLKYITYDIDTCLRRKQCLFIQDAVSGIDVENKTITAERYVYSYDYLLIAAGSEANFYQNKKLAEAAYSITEPANLAKIKNKLNDKNINNVVIAGGGYTGVEIATHVKKLSKILRKELNVMIIESSDQLLNVMPRWIKEYVYGELALLGVTYQLSCRVTDIQDRRIQLSNGVVVDDALLIWSAGVKPPDFVEKLPFAKDKMGRLITDKYLKVDERVFVAGDCAAYLWKNDYLRMAVRFAIDEGRAAAKNIVRSMAQQSLKRYIPIDPGYLVPLAGTNACGDVFKVKIKGYPGILMHYLLCFIYSYGIKNRWKVLTQLLLKRGALL